MKAPVKYMQGKRVRYEKPDKEWLEHQYVTLGKTTPQISREFGIAYWATLCSWLRDAGIEKRSAEERGKRHSRKMSGKGNPAYRNGTSQGYQKRKLRKAVPDEVCGWCGSIENVQIHHIDHDRDNANIENLMWLCYHCNVMEASIYNLSANGRVTAETDGDTLTIKFTTSSKEVTK
jgi:hypothetical protein